MPTYAIPPIYRQGFQRLAHIPDEDFEQFAVAAETAMPSVSTGAIAAHLAEVAGLPLDDVNEVLGAILSAAAVRAHDGVSGAMMADSLSVADLELPAEGVEAFRVRVGRLLDAQGLRLTLRTIDLLAADERLLVDSRIVTDLRPVFPEPGTTPSEGPLSPAGGLIVHSLRLEYLEGGENRTFAVSLDPRDINTLRQALDRAERKAEAIARLAADGGLQIIPFPQAETGS